MSMTSTPDASRPATSALCSPSPLGRLSRPTETAPFTPFSARNAAYAPATAVATSSVRSLPATPRMSYSRKIARESAIESLWRAQRYIPAHSGGAALGKRDDGVGKQTEDENDGCGSPDHCARPAARSLGQKRRRGAWLHEHHHHHVQVVSRADHACDYQYDRQARLRERCLERRLQDVPLGEESNAAEYRETEQRQHEYRHRDGQARSHAP